MTNRPISATQLSLHQIITQPRPMLSALWASCRTFWSLRFARFNEMVTFRSKQENPNTSSSITSLSLQKVIKAGQHEDSQSSTSIKDLPLKPKKNYSEDSLTEDHSEQPSDSGKISPLEQDIGTALTVFKETLARNRKLPALVPERGTIVVSGLVQLDGPRGHCILDVAGIYHPRRSRWMGCNFIVRHIHLRDPLSIVTS